MPEPQSGALTTSPHPPKQNDTRLEGFEPPALGLEVRCSIQLSYRRKSWSEANTVAPFKAAVSCVTHSIVPQVYTKDKQYFSFSSKAGDGNRTHVAGLEGQNSTIELHPHALIGAEGFEPPTPWSQTTYATKLRYAPTTTMIIANCLFIVKHLKSFSVQCLCPTAL